MDYITDSDTENSLPVLPASSIDGEMLRDVVSYFSAETRARLRAETENTPFAGLFEELPLIAHENGSQSEELRDSNDSLQILQQNNLVEPVLTESEPLQSEPAQPVALTHTAETAPAETAPAETEFRRPRSLRKRTFASRHPYIADQADWLGICTVDSINEMFDGDEEISKVVRALNQLYLQKKKRYPEEDRYRLKDFYTHLGHSKLLAVRGDPEAEITADSGETIENVDSQERNYDPEGHSSQMELSAEEDELIPYEDFDIPYTQEETEVRNSHTGLSHEEGLQIGAEAIRQDTSFESSETESDGEPEEQYIKVGGRYRKVSTILRGVLPESAKRLGILDRKAPVKRRRKITREVTPRRGLAIRKMGSSNSNTAELEKELYARSGNNDELASDSLATKTALLSSSRPQFERPVFEGEQPSFTRDATTFSYVLDSPEPQYISSGSDSEVEILPAETGFFQRPSHSSSSLHHPTNFYQSDDDNDEFTEQPMVEAAKSSNFEDQFLGGEVEEFDEIDHDLARSTGRPKQSSRRPTSNKSRHTMTRNSTGTTGTRNKAAATRKSQLRLKTFSGRKVPLRRPLATRPAPRALPSPFAKGSLKSRKARVLDKLQSRLPAFRQAPGHKESVQHDPASAESTSEMNSEAPKKHVVSNKTFQPPLNRPFRRDPLVSTSVFEVESSRKFIGPSLTTHDSVVQNFHPTRQSLLGSVTSATFNSLAGLDDISSVRGLLDGRVFFASEDSVTIPFRGKTFSLAMFSRTESKNQVTSLLALVKTLLEAPKVLLKADVRLETNSALCLLIKWFLICREKPTTDLILLLKNILADFSKLQTKEVRALQITIHAQLLYMLWVFCQIELSYKSGESADLSKVLTGYTADFFMIFFTTFTAQEFALAFADESSTGNLSEAVMLIYTIHEEKANKWWPAMVQAIDEMVPFGNGITELFDLVYLLGAIIPKRHFSWAPFLAILQKLKSAENSLGHRHFIETCELAHQRLEWPLEEKILIHLYGVFGVRKFSNFADEVSVPTSIGVVYSRADIPRGSTFENFLGLLYVYISELSLAKQVKRLISKLLASSHYRYVRGRKSQIMFANRLNLIVLLSQLSSVDFGNQLTNLISQISHSADSFVYGRSLDALQVICDGSSKKNVPIPINSIEMLFKSLTQDNVRKAVAPGLFQKLINLMGRIFRGDSLEHEAGVFGLLKILKNQDLCNVPKASIIELLGTVFLAIMEVEVYITNLNEWKSALVADFQKSLMKFLSSQMDRLPVSAPNEDQSIESIVELTIQIWMLCGKISGTQHWNNMVYQKYSYLGNPISRNRFVMFFCLEYIQYSDIDGFVLQEIEKVFLTGLVSPTLSKYSVELYHSLRNNNKSVFWDKGSSFQDISSVLALQTFRLRIVGKAFEQVVTSPSLHDNEKSAMCSSFVKRLLDVYTDNRLEQSVTEMCKKMTEILLKTSKRFVSGIDEFWELSSKLGLPNKSIQNRWSEADEQGKVHLLNIEFISALVYGKDYMAAMNNWTNETNNVLIFTLLEIYYQALSVSDAYWAHISLILEYILFQLNAFRIDTSHAHFKRFLEITTYLAGISDVEGNKKYNLYEIKALTACTLILENAFQIFDGYKDKQDIRAFISTFVRLLFYPKWRQRTEPVFSKITIDKLQSGVTNSYHPKHEHTNEEYHSASLLLKDVAEDLLDIAYAEVKQGIERKGIDYFDFV
ncbi:Mus7/MMS22 family protein [Metschnikowia aff. pulcherrima]|uniref:Mus7/MMS22 family protein n=1 Tax=Metschnikowia aff. pulcherrima TaxID=2163413 RepID=A0A4P6XVV6_9ASCO|nr:Mus7/MMS22 family protein [Metschnikowia aff. pulcherrima]